MLIYCTFFTFCFLQSFYNFTIFLLPGHDTGAGGDVPIPRVRGGPGLRGPLAGQVSGGAKM